ncbi:MAG: hypothetical protein DWI57_17850, partial [Chloroflexi bacterium]
MPVRLHFVTRVFIRILFAFAVTFSVFPADSTPLHGQANQLPNPILFVTQFPIAADFTTIGAVFGNHRADMDS